MSWSIWEKIYSQWVEPLTCPWFCRHHQSWIWLLTSDPLWDLGHVMFWLLFHVWVLLMSGPRYCEHTWTLVALFIVILIHGYKGNSHTFSYLYLFTLASLTLSFFFFLPRSSFPLLGVKLDVAQHLKISHKLCNHKESLKACDILVISQRLDVRLLLTWFRLLLNGFLRWKQFGNSALPLLLLNHRVRSALAAYPSVAILRNTEPTPVIWPTPIPPYTGTLAGWSNVSLWRWTVPGCSHQRSVQ